MSSVSLGILETSDRVTTKIPHSTLHFFDDDLCENLMFCDKQFPINVSMDGSYSL